MEFGIIDCHAHIFPPLAGEAGFPDAAIHLLQVTAVALELGAVDEDRQGRAQLAVTQFVKQNRFSRLVVFAVEVVVGQLDRLDIAAIGHPPHRLGFAEERIHFPELVLLRFVERMVVALRAADLQA